MPEKPEGWAHAEGTDPQDPCDMAKAGLLESESPEGYPAHPLLPRVTAGPSGDG